jgi:hypothetical protein
VAESGQNDHYKENSARCQFDDYVINSVDLRHRIHTDDVVIWFTEGEDPRVTSAARRGNLALALNTDDVVIWVTEGERLHDLWSHNAYHLW